MTTNKNPIKITDVVLRDAHQSLFATRLRLDDMLPICEKLDKVGFWSLETWGGATFDSCIRFLGEDPWERARELKRALPNTRQQMLLRGQNLLGYRHYADDVVDKFVERAVASGIDVFRVFDAMNDPRNLSRAMKAVKKQGAHAQGTISFTTSPVHNTENWLALAKEIEDMGADSIAIKDMSGILTPYDAYELIGKMKSALDVPISLHAHATSGLSSMTQLKAIEAGIDHIDTAISSMSMTYGHSPTEALVATLAGTERDPGFDLELLEEIATYFRAVRKKYAKFEGQLRGTDTRILIAQVPGGMLTNMEGQLKEQGASDKFDEVLAEIPRIRKDLGYIPLVTPTSQIVGTQAVLNVLTGERYKSISKETQAILKGEYGSAPAPFNKELQAKVLDGAEAVTCRPADLLENEFESLTEELKGIASEKGIKLASDVTDDVLTYALFPQIGLKFLEHRGDSSKFEPAPTGAAAADTAPAEDSGVYTVDVNGKSYVAAVDAKGSVSVTINGKTYATSISEGGDVTASSAAAPVSSSGFEIPAPLAGNIFKILVKPGDVIEEGQVVMILEAMKMETEVSAVKAGTVSSVTVKEGDSVAVGDTLLTL